MNIHKLLLYLYPRVWRIRYEEEVLVVLASHPISVFELLDVLCGAFDAHLHPCFGTATMPLSEKMRQMLSALRGSLLAIFCAYVGFLLAGAGFQKMTEDAALRSSGIAGLSFHLVALGAVVALLAMLAGSLPVAIAVIKFTLVRRRRGPLLGLFVPILVFMVLLGALFLLKSPGHSDSSPLSPGEIILARSLFFGVPIAAAIISAGSVCFAVLQSEIPEKLLRFALLPFVLVTISMVLMMVSTLLWGLGLHYGAPQLFAGNDGLMGLSTTGTWLGIVIDMVLATVLAVLSLVRGLSARSTLRHIAA